MPRRTFQYSLGANLQLTHTPIGGADAFSHFIDVIPVVWRSLRLICGKLIQIALLSAFNLCICFCLCLELVIFGCFYFNFHAIAYIHTYIQMYI